MNRGLEPVMKAGQGQHFSVPVWKKHRFSVNSVKPIIKILYLLDIWPPFMQLYEILLCSNWKPTWGEETLESLWGFSRTQRAQRWSLPWSESVWSSPAPEFHRPAPLPRLHHQPPEGWKKSSVSDSGTLYNSKRLHKTCLPQLVTSFQVTYLFLQLPVWYAEEIYLQCAVATNTGGVVSVSGAGGVMFLCSWWEVELQYSPVEEFVVGVLGSLHISTHTVHDLNQLLQLLLQALLDQNPAYQFSNIVTSSHVMVSTIKTEIVYLPRPPVCTVQLSSRTTLHSPSVEIIIHKKLFNVYISHLLNASFVEYAYHIMDIWFITIIITYVICICTHTWRQMINLWVFKVKGQGHWLPLFVSGRGGGVSLNE